MSLDARNRSAPRNGTISSFQVGDVFDLPFDNGTFDAVAFESLLTIPAIAPEIEPSPTLVPTQPPVNQEYLAVFEAVWATIDETYFDPAFGGLDWDAIHDEYELRVAAAESESTSSPEVSYV
jgi:hypothetical protein